MNTKDLISLSWRNFLFWFSRKVDYPLVPPDTVQVNFTFRCNLHCKMCNMRNHMQQLENRGDRIEIDSDTFIKIIKESAELGIKNILFIGGEPFMREDLFDLVKYAKSLSLFVGIITNGVLLNRDIIDKCFDSKLDCLNISIDAVSEDVFSTIRGRNVLSSIIRNVTDLNLLREEKMFSLPRISAICTIMNDNLEELLEVVYLCRELKIDNISFQPVVINNVDQSVRDFCSAVFIPPSRYITLDESIDKLIDCKSKNPDFILNSVKHLRSIKKYFRRELYSKDIRPCYAGYNRLQITQDYVVYFCIPPNNQYKTSFGDVSRDSLEDLWYSKKAKIRRKLIRKCNVPCLQSCS